MKTRFVLEMSRLEKQELKRKTFELGFKTTKEFLLVAAEKYYNENIASCNNLEKVLEVK